MHYDIAGLEGMRSSSPMPGLARVQSLGTQSSHAFASALGGSLSRSQTPDPQHVPARPLGGPLSRSQTPDPQHVVTRSPSPSLSAMGGRFGIPDRQNIGSSSSFNGVSSNSIESEEIVAGLSSISLASNGAVEEERHTKSQLQKDIAESQNYIFIFKMVRTKITNINIQENLQQILYRHLF